MVLEDALQLSIHIALKDMDGHARSFTPHRTLRSLAYPVTCACAQVQAAQAGRHVEE